MRLFNLFCSHLPCICLAFYALLSDPSLLTSCGIYLTVTDLIKLSGICCFLGFNLELSFDLLSRSGYR
ncbi:hypothetical protein C2G38_2052250 [Gigaspora rosea]|uniref:Uncharacterized protein n=1 Tax=Gigaspora rosea TaxID=44941 RepID=A0A397W8I2_9GLOM|nr:hypothetical protein C2G38_2052250 [Gigaspora rosea]